MNFLAAICRAGVMCCPDFPSRREDLVLRFLGELLAESPLLLAASRIMESRKLKRAISPKVARLLGVTNTDADVCIKGPAFLQQCRTALKDHFSELPIWLAEVSFEIVPQFKLPMYPNQLFPFPSIDVDSKNTPKYTSCILISVSESAAQGTHSSIPCPYHH